jgi:gas vesicle protein
MNNSANNNFFSNLGALIVGGILGATTMFFLTPRSGKANRALVKAKVSELQEYVDDEREALEDKIQNIFGEVNAITQALYNDARRLWDGQVRALEKTMKKIDKGAYQEMVDNVMEKLQGNKKYDATNLGKIKRYLNNQWRRFNEAMST